MQSIRLFPVNSNSKLISPRVVGAKNKFREQVEVTAGGRRFRAGTPVIRKQEVGEKFQSWRGGNSLSNSETFLFNVDGNFGYSDTKGDSSTLFYGRYSFGSLRHMSSRGKNRQLTIFCS